MAIDPPSSPIAGEHLQFGSLPEVVLPTTVSVDHAATEGEGVGSDNEVVVSVGPIQNQIGVGAR